MSMTDLNALGLSWLMEARKLPAAPALQIANAKRSMDQSHVKQNKNKGRIHVFRPFTCTAASNLFFFFRDVPRRERARREKAYMTKSTPPNSSTHLSTAVCRLCTLLTSTAPNPRTLAPRLAVARSRAIFSVFSTFRPTMHASAPKCTNARTCALQIVPAPPVQKTTLSAGVLYFC